MPSIRSDITGVILVGGKSRRMGRDKAFLEFAGGPLFERVLEVFRESFERVLLVGDRPERFAGYDLPVLEDIFPGSALGGLYTGLHLAQTDHIFVSSCDLPFPSKAVIGHLCSLKNGFDAVVPSSLHGFEPLFALYSRKCLDPMRELLESGNLCIYEFYPQVRVRRVPCEELAPLDPEGKSLMNINTPGDLDRLRKKALPAAATAVAFVAKSGTGKTTLLEKVIARLKDRGYRVGVIKHDAHRFDIDHPGKDSYRLTAAGADAMLISSSEKLALVKKHAASPSVEELVSTFFTDVDIVLTEGFKSSALPKIELHRRERSRTLLCRGKDHDPALLAVASDEPLELDVPLLDINDGDAVADFIERRFLK